MGLTSQECHGAFAPVWDFSYGTFNAGGGVKFEQFVHAGVLLVRSQQTHIEEVVFVECIKPGARVSSFIGKNTRHVKFSKLLDKKRLHLKGWLNCSQNICGCYIFTK